ncbi:hypothetical protein CAPN005_08340 [Capnocytophaga cynodegmi]|nr:hypothetical protein CAPN005_08340 [Capnocytophaga cynodegmi]
MQNINKIFDENISKMKLQIIYFFINHTSKITEKTFPKKHIRILQKRLPLGDNINNLKPYVTRQTHF